jgi:hypothetical protein
VISFFLPSPYPSTYRYVGPDSAALCALQVELCRDRKSGHRDKAPAAADAQDSGVDAHGGFPSRVLDLCAGGGVQVSVQSIPPPLFFFLLQSFNGFPQRRAPLGRQPSLFLALSDHL